MKNIKKALLFFVSFLILASPSPAEEVRLKATADIWLSGANAKEQDSSMGRASRFKLKAVQEMAAVRFDASPVKGKEILSATLYLHPTQDNNQLRYIRMSTVNQDWVQGDTRRAYGPPDGSTYNYADFRMKRPWAWPGSQFPDVTFSSGQSLSCYGERKKEKMRWISVPVSPELVYAMAIGDTDGIAIQDGGTLDYFNNMVHTSEVSFFAPYIVVETGDPIRIVPDKPQIKVEPDPARSRFTTGAVKITIQPDDKVFSWRVKLNGDEVDRWRVKHPVKGKEITFSLEGLVPDLEYDVEVVAVSKSGDTSAPATALVRSSDKLSQEVQFSSITEPGEGNVPLTRNEKMKVWALPGLVKISPEEPVAMHRDIGAGAPIENSNAVWDGEKVSLFGIRGEYVDFQLCIEKLGEKLKEVKVLPGPLVGPGGEAIGGGEIELFVNWYSKTKRNKWQPAYQVPIAHGAPFSIPYEHKGKARIEDQENQTVYIDLYIPKDAQPGMYKGTFEVSSEGASKITIPVELKVHDLLMPDALAFWPEMNAYSIRPNVHDYWRLGHQHRCVCNFWKFRPEITGKGKDIKVDWEEYDKAVGPLLTGEAFKNNRRAGYPTEVMYLPFADSWPTPLTKETYDYQGHWPERGEDKKHLTRQMLTAPYIGDGLSRDYKDAFFAVQRQFIEHFREKGWNSTEMQCFYGGKKTHRINHGSNMWWTTDEPLHWDDWLALQFFDRLWTEGREKLGASEKIWVTRADISRPQWQGRVMEGILDVAYYGGFNNYRTYKRCSIIEDDTGCRIRSYGSANAHDKSNTETVTLCLSMWLNGSDAFVPWQTLGKKRSLDKQEGSMGNALFVPGDEFGLPVMGDMRLKAFRKGEQMIEYLVMLSEKYNLNREQLSAMVHKAVQIRTGRLRGASSDNADALQFSPLKAWKIKELRRTMLELLEKEAS